MNVRQCTLLGFCASATVGAFSPQWQPPPAHEQQLPASVDCWEPAMATGPNGQVYVVAGRRAAPRARLA